MFLAGIFGMVRVVGMRGVFPRLLVMSMRVISLLVMSLFIMSWFVLAGL